MANEQITIGEGVTEPIPITLLSVDRETDEGTALDLTGATLLDMRIQTSDKDTQFDYNSVDDPSQIEITTEEDGLITFTPLGTEFLASELWYECYFTITDAAGSLIRFPNDGIIPIEVLEAF